MPKASKASPTPGAVLKAIMDDYQLTPAKLAEDIGLSQSAVRQIVAGKTRITVSAALRLAKYFGTVPVYWLGLQTLADLAEAAKDVKLSGALKGIPKVKKPPKGEKKEKPAVPAKSGAEKNKKTIPAKARKPQIPPNG
jgi:addiction module HigA family antidote